MKPSDELAELLKVDRAPIVSLDVLPQTQRRAVDDLGVGQRRRNTEAVRQKHLARANKGNRPTPAPQPTHPQ